jgi:hypothetical protein
VLDIIAVFASTYSVPISEQRHRTLNSFLFFMLSNPCVLTAIAIALALGAAGVLPENGRNSENRNSLLQGNRRRVAGNSRIAAGHRPILEKSGSAVAVRDTDEEVTDSGNQARRQTKYPHGNRRGLDRYVHEHEDQDPDKHGQFDLQAVHTQ